MLTFDLAKNTANIAKHGMSFGGVDTIFDSPVRTMEDRSADYGESRFNTLGMLNGQVVHFTWTEDDEAVRAVSLRPATPAEKVTYVRYLQGR